MNAGGESRSRGLAMVEFALVLAFVLVPLLTGIVDLGLTLHAKGVLTDAAREGALEAARGDDPMASVAEYIGRAGLDPGKAQISMPCGPANQPLGAEVCVRIEYQAAELMIIPWHEIFSSLAVLTAQASARHI